jgi:hypothetical protein
MTRSKQQNEFSKSEENNAPFWRRLLIYQKERFPILGHGLLVATFSFSAVSYSRICRGATGFISPGIFATGIFTTVSLFLLVRIFDEFKDAEDDAQYRKELAVPRGLISFYELKCMAVVTIILQVTLNLIIAPVMLVIYFAIMAYLFLMTKEFFIPARLKKHPFWYVTSHMFIIPFIDVYASGLDWLLAGAKAPIGLLFFFGVSYMNGIVLEIGRKIRVPEKESPGVDTYTSMLGIKSAITLWLGMLTVTLALSMAASYFAAYGIIIQAVLCLLYVLCSIPAMLFLKNPTEKSSKIIEYSAAIWTVGMYFTLGAGPMISTLLPNQFL